MKKQTLFVLAMAAAMTAAMAQVTPKEEVIRNSGINKFSHFGIGITGGIDRNYHIVDMSYMGDYQYSKYAPGTAYGLHVSYAPTRWLSFCLDGVMIQKNYYRAHVTNNMSFPDTTTNEYVNVPLVMKLTVGKKVRLHAFGGGYVGYWLTSNRRGRAMGMSGNPEYDVDMDFTSAESIKRDNRLDAGFTYGAGLSGMIYRHFEVGAEIRWYYGVLDIQNEYMSTVSPRYNTTMVIQGGLSYWF